MENKSYGIRKQTDHNNLESVHLEELKLLGFTILRGVLNDNELDVCREKLDSVYNIQEQKFGKDLLQAINELDMARCPLAYDPFFLELATRKEVLLLIEMVLGNYFILHLQNGIINRPGRVHHQSSWHRDLPYQDFTISSPLALSALWCIDDFNSQTGGTQVLPGSHLMDLMPSQQFVNKQTITVEANAGDVILFDSMLFHRSGQNNSPFVRRGINNVYTVGILKQQINLQTATSNHYANNNFLSRFLGYDTNVANSVDEYRLNRFQKIKNK